jgi:hypothetical protein
VDFDAYARQLPYSRCNLCLQMSDVKNKMHLLHLGAISSRFETFTSSGSNKRVESCFRGALELRRGDDGHLSRAETSVPEFLLAHP